MFVFSSIPQPLVFADVEDPLKEDISGDGTEDGGTQTELSEDALRDIRLVRLNATFVLCRLIDCKQYKTVADSPIAQEALQVGIELI